MKLYTTIFLLGCALLFWGCEDDLGTGLSTTTNVTIRFVATYDGAPLIMGDIYEYQNNFRVSFSDFQFYISYISLRGGLGGESNNTLLEEVELIDFSETNTNESGALSGVTLPFSNITVDQYSGVEMGIGVIADLNRTKPNEYGNSHPLFNADNYRSSWDSYIFTKINGEADLNQDGIFGHSLIYETLSDEVYQEVSLTGDVFINENTTNVVTIAVDLKKLFVRDDNDYLDIQTNNIIYENVEIMQYLSENYNTALSLQ